jgi:hypothetical protein
MEVKAWIFMVTLYNTVETRWIETLLQTPILWQKLLIHFIDYFCSSSQRTPTTRKQVDILKIYISFKKKPLLFKCPSIELSGKVKTALLQEHPP